MRLLVIGCGAVLVLALVVILFTAGPDVLSDLPALLRPQNLAWLFILVVAVIVLGSAIWSHEQLQQQRRTTEMIESRLRLEEAQRDVERATTQLRSEEHTSELQSLRHLVCRLLLEKKKKNTRDKS